MHFFEPRSTFSLRHRTRFLHAKHLVFHFISISSFPMFMMST